MNAGLFYCDIAGTFDGENNREKNVKTLIKHLEEVCIINNLDKIVFSFSTGDESTAYLFDSVDEIKTHTENTKIVLGKQFMQTGCYDSNGQLLKSYNYINKGKELCIYVGELLEKDNIKWVGYADDSININMISMLKNSIGVLYPGLDIYGFIPSSKHDVITETVVLSAENGIYGLNDCMSKALYIEPDIFNKVYAKTGTCDK